MIESLDDKVQIVCDECPASFAKPYDGEDFAIMVADARAAGWLIVKKPPAPAGAPDLFGPDARPPRIAGQEKPQPFTHTCPTCRNPGNDRRLF